MAGGKEGPNGFSDRFRTIMELVMNAIGDAGNVLVIDDQYSVRMSLTMLLSPYYEVHTAENAAQAFKILREQNIDLVTIDMSIPGVQGYDLLPYIRKIRPNVEIIVLTGFPTLKSAVRSIHYGAQDYFSKPFDTVDFLYATQCAVEKKKAIDGYTVLLKEIGRELEPERHRDVEDLVGFVEGRKWIRGRSTDSL